MSDDKDVGNERQGKEGEVIVVIVPFPAQGHLNQLLHLSRLILSYNIPVHYVSTTMHSRQAKLRVQGWNPLSTRDEMIKFHDFPTPPFVSPPPNPSSASKFPLHLLPSFYAALHLRAPVGELLFALAPTTRRLVVIYDFLISSVIQDVASIPNAEAYSFQCTSAFRVSSTVCEITGESPQINNQIVKQLPSRSATVTSQVMDFIKMQELHNYSSGVLFNTCRPIEGPFLDALAKVNTNQWAIGPFNPVEVCDNSTNGRHRCLEWLDRQLPNSVIFVSFGTTTSLTDEQIECLALGLEASGQKFIWVLRDADKGDIFTGDVRVYELPRGYQDRIKVRGQGMIIRDWAPQLEILAHASTGGFMSHCGWNSCLESITMGVPMATWPMHSDQPHNALLVTKILKIGVVVRDWALGDELVQSLTIENAVRELMASREGQETRKRMAELSMAVKRSVADGGEMNDFIAHIRR